MKWVARAVFFNDIPSMMYFFLSLTMYLLLAETILVNMYCV